MPYVSARIWGAALSVLLALSTGCTPSTQSGAGDAAPPTRAAPLPVITAAQARKVFERYDRVNAAADASMDPAVIRKVQTGALLKESLAMYRLYRRAGTKDRAVHFVRPRFIIPAVRTGAGYPRFFVVRAKHKGDAKDHASQIVYFVQEKAGGAWKATAATWALTESLDKPPSPEPSPTATAADGTVHISLRPKRLPGLQHAASGNVELSNTATADRAACSNFADLLSFTPPHGRTTNSHFAKGPFTSDLVRFYNGWTDDALYRTLGYKTVGTALPVFRLTNGNALVGCTLQQNHSVTGVGPDGTVVFDKDSDVDLALAGDGREWRSVDAVSSMTVLIEVPSSRSSPATVIACDCYNPQLLSATGVGAG
ncbi:hypothetical protein AB0J38_11565 [Streptomyces sp. NPDC050095]|uniref:hypothetical protein n=1 Tax=unclassified Streptomyces TaxID=2593676 RepID=UPI003416CB46